MSGYILITAPPTAAFVARTCESVLAHTLPPLRWIVVDAASSHRSDAGTDSLPSGIPQGRMGPTP